MLNSMSTDKTAFWSNQSKMGKRRRRYTKRPESEVMRHDRPHLRLIPQELWIAVEARRKEVCDNYSGREHGAPGRRTSHPFSGVLYCGVCGHRMTDGGSSARYYKCSAAMSGGICDNRLPVREDTLVEVAVAESKRVLLQTDLYDHLRAQIEARLRTFKVESDAEQQRLEKLSRRLDAEVERLVVFIRGTDPATIPGVFDQIRKSLDDVTTEQRAVRERLESLRQQAKSPPRLPTMDEILERVLDVEARIIDDPWMCAKSLGPWSGANLVILASHRLWVAQDLVQGVGWARRSPGTSCLARRGPPRHAGGTEDHPRKGPWRLARFLGHEIFLAHEIFHGHD